MFFEQLNIACKMRGKTVTKVALELNISKSNVTNWKNGVTPNGDIIVRLSELLNVSADFLLFGKEKNSSAELSTDEQELITYYKELDDKYKEKVLTRAETLAEVLAEQREGQYTCSQNKLICVDCNKIKIRLYDMPASAGTGLYLDNSVAEIIDIKCTDEAQKADYAVPVSGDSMEPDFYDGDIVLVRSCPCVNPGEIGIFVLDGDVYIKEYDGDRLLSHNESYDPLLLKNYSTAICLGRVLGVAETVN